MRYFFSTLILFLSCTTLPEDVPGCTNSNACNFNPEANEDDSSCAILDCLGECGGTAYLDSCGDCDSDPDNDCNDCSEILASFTIENVDYDCIEGVIKDGYYCGDLEIIREIITSNPGSIHSGMDVDRNKIITPLEYGYQNWTDNGRLLTLDLNYNENVVEPAFCNFRLNILPENIGNLDSLQNLQLKDNEISSLPGNIGNLKNLEMLIMESNLLTELPNSIGNLVNLERLVLSNNQLISLPASIGNLTSLEKLWLQHNQLVSLPESLGNLIQLEWLYLNNNLLEELPDGIGNLVNLKLLNIANNMISSLPESMCDEINSNISMYEGLVTFSIRDNQFCDDEDGLIDPVPSCMHLEYGNQNCSQCKPWEFNIDGYCADSTDYNILQNFLDLNEYSQSLPYSEGIPDSARECVNTDWWDNGRLVEITFHHKQLTSIIPENIGDLTKLKILRLTGNKLTGEIPDKITNLNDLKILQLNSNNLSGGIPENIGALSNIDTLWLNNNNLGCFEYNYECDPNGRDPYCCVSHCDDINECSGEIPQSITNLNGLQHLKLKVNNLSGIIPEEIGSMENLKYLFLDNNNLSGGIPPSIGNLTNLKRLYLLNNNLSGQIPESICTIYTINSSFWLYLNNNKLCPGSSGYPECIPEDHLGPQYCSP